MHLHAAASVIAVEQVGVNDPARINEGRENTQSWSGCKLGTIE